MKAGMEMQRPSFNSTNPSPSFSGRSVAIGSQSKHPASAVKSRRLDIQSQTDTMFAMKCPHCLVEFHDAWLKTYIPTNAAARQQYGVYATTCPACEDVVVRLFRGTYNGFAFTAECTPWLVYPRATSRAPLPVEVDDKDIAGDYKEACLVLLDSPKASAALGRRCLQNLLRTKAGVKHGNLADEIKEVLDRKTLPSTLADNVDAVRQIGNFAAHPMKSTNSGEILPVEPDEAEWTLDVLEGLFGHFYVQPARDLAKRAALDKKLADAGRSAMKKP
jgi:hypothetical protein